MKKIRDGKQAVEYATKACELDGWEDATSLETLAAAYAESGDFTKAIEWQTKAMKEEPPNVDGEKSEMRLRLDLYKQNKPCRDEPHKDEPQE
jgi:tetratricopeptide (TPR) repeat protein